MPAIFHNELHRSRSNGWQSFRPSGGGGKHRTFLRPDANGHFDRENVTAVCARKNCTVEFASEYVAFVRCAESQHRLTAIDREKWDPIAVLEARSNAASIEPFRCSPMFGGGARRRNKCLRPLFRRRERADSPLHSPAGPKGHWVCLIQRTKTRVGAASLGRDR